MSGEKDNVNGTYGLLSKGLKQAYTNAEWSRASQILSLMAYILETENKHTDELKALILSFYIDLSGVDRMPFTNNDTVERIRTAYSKSSMSETDICCLYFDVIRGDTMPRHSLTVIGSFRVFTYCLFGKKKKLEEVLNNLSK